ncbi:hypothetical protein DFP72DRAFT_1058243 [Ephemerocybe angulata]|uniref:F-box domain-containing protein n=1 Tax=Ephemerocybe angulata TaxID=980116 RepID=A0A8H6MEJ3_9AGAR|nr:hypothetical protein DFP72DRAFT_1058243 [Tulosesus angulatus]
MGKRKNDTTEAPTKGKKKKLCPERSEERIVSTKKPTTRKRVSETTVPGRSKSKAMTRRVWREPSVDSDEGRFDPYFSDDPQSYEGSPPPEPANIKDLPVELLWEIFDYVLLQAYQRPTKAGDVGTSGPFSPNSVDRNISPKARNILKWVCQQWKTLIINEARLWGDILISGKRIPHEDEYFACASLLPACCGPNHHHHWVNTTPLDPYYRRILSNNAGWMKEVKLAKKFIARSGDYGINLVLDDPTCQTGPEEDGKVTPYRPRTGILDLIHNTLAEHTITRLSITARDVGFVRSLLDPKLAHELQPINEWAWHLDDCADEEKIKACFSEDVDTSSRRMPPRKANPSEKDKLARKAIRKQIERAEEECDRLAENLVTLRIVEPSEKLSHWDSDWQPCVLPPGRYPALRHVELIITEQLCSFTLPYRQLTHLTLVTLEGDDVVLGILKGCRKLKSLTITRPTGKDADLESTAAPIVLSNLSMLAIELLDRNTGRYFLDRIQVPKLNSLKVDSECPGGYERCAPVIQDLLERSQCAPRDLHLNFVDSEIKGPVATKLAELLAFTSESLEHLTLRARLVDETWLKDFLPPRLQTLALVSFSIPRVLDDYNDYVDEEDGPTLKFFIQALHWTKEWMTGASPADKARRRITFLAGPPSISQVYYGDTNKGHYKSYYLPPQKIADAIQGLKATGVQAEMTWLFRGCNWKALR